MILRPGQVAVVTGAGSGIGRGLCAALAARGLALALVDRDAAGLEATAAQLTTPTSEHVTDVGDRAQVAALPEAVLAAHGAVHLLVNNAGVSVAGPFVETSLDDFEWIVGVNFWGPIYGCHAFLPHLLAQPAAHVVNVLSDFALLGFPTKSAYCATKFGVRGFSEALRAELDGTSVGLTCVYPGPVDTALCRRGRAADPAKRELEAQFMARRGIPMERVTTAILRGIERDAPRVLIGRETCAMDWAKRLAPELVERLTARFWRRVPFL